MSTSPYRPVESDRLAMAIKNLIPKTEYLNGTYIGADGSKATPRTAVGTSTGYMVTFNHDVTRLGSGDQGGPWLMHRGYTHLVKTSWPRAKSGKGYAGDVTSWGPPSLLSYTIPSDASIDAMGATAISAVLPTEPEWSASTFLAETLQDGVPKMVGVETWREKTLRARQAGSEYLNVEFGWLPFVSDLQSFAHSVRNSSEIIRDYRDGANKKIRRHFRFPAQINSQGSSANSFIRTAGSYDVGSTRTYYVQQKVINSWFSGAFRYYLPVGNSAGERFTRYARYADKLLGVKPTPETVWNAAPWSWAVDWRTDVGNVITNYSRIGHDGLVLQYGYMMWSMLDFSLSQSRYGITENGVVHKVRLPANPYGFGVDMSSLSARQISILAALGLSHS